MSVHNSRDVYPHLAPSAGKNWHEDCKIPDENCEECVDEAKDDGRWCNEHELIRQKPLLICPECH